MCTQPARQQKSMPPETQALFDTLGTKIGNAAGDHIKPIRKFKRRLTALKNRWGHHGGIERLFSELERNGEAGTFFSEKKAVKLKKGERLPSFDELVELAHHGVDIPYVLIGKRICKQKSLNQLAGVSQPVPNEFVDIFMSYGGSTSEEFSETQRLAFCNRLLARNLSRYPYREEFIKAFSAGGSMAYRQRIAAWLSRYPHISISDLVNSIFHCLTHPEGLVNYAGEDGCQ